MSPPSTHSVESDHCMTGHRSRSDSIHLSCPGRGVLNAASVSSFRTNPGERARPFFVEPHAHNRLTFFRLIPIIVQRCHSEPRMS